MTLLILGNNEYKTNLEPDDSLEISYNSLISNQVAGVFCLIISKIYPNLIQKVSIHKNLIIWSRILYRIKDSFEYHQQSSIYPFAYLCVSHDCILYVYDPFLPQEIIGNGVKYETEVKRIGKNDISELSWSKPINSRSKEERR